MPGLFSLNDWAEHRRPRMELPLVESSTSTSYDFAGARRTDVSSRIAESNALLICVFIRVSPLTRYATVLPAYSSGRRELFQWMQTGLSPSAGLSLSSAGGK